MIFQDPISSLNPRRRVAEIIAEPLRVWGPHDEGEQVEIVDRMLHAVGIAPGKVARDKRPHEFSGGQSQTDFHRSEPGPRPPSSHLR
ncbi:MAG: hypothetical protein CM1200mP26_01530 [Acidimicrobiales bacterium]|nr:MAG: hypothetical protein CM1200mP26_01530 [Acidimicrobiales bacterium]